MKRVVTVLLGAVTVLLVILSIFLTKRKDTTAPVISVVDPNVVYVEDSDTTALIKAVKAIDTNDGDVSDSIRIEKLTVLEDKATAKVQFVAKDTNNNVTKMTVNFAFKPDPNKPAEPETKKYNVVIINNLAIENLANSYAKVLQQDGHKIVSIGLSTDPPAVETVIYVQKEGDGNELLEFFPNATILVGNIANRINVPAKDADAFIILGYQHSILPTINNN